MIIKDKVCFIARRLYHVIVPLNSSKSRTPLFLECYTFQRFGANTLKMK